MPPVSTSLVNEYPLTRLAPTLAQLLNLPAPDALGHYSLTLWRHELPYLSSLHETNSLVLRAIMPTITPVNFTKCAM